MSFMDFWILPKYRFPQGKSEEQSLQDLNEHPVGTGPYFLAERGDKTVRFRANPRFREGGTPHIKEIQFNEIQPLDAIGEFAKGKLDLVYGVRKAHRAQLVQEGRQSCLHRLNTPSVYFLAPNYAARNTPLVDANFRLAIAHAINRSAILTQYFRDDEHDNANRPLTGPFPCDSWANSPMVEDFKTERARSFLAQARQKFTTIRPVTLCYPDEEDQDTENACKLIKQNLSEIGIEIELEPVNINDWHERIIKQHNFDLAYWRHDFLNATYWLWPLFNPQAKNPGTNFMGYDPDPT